jgi:hypothetical protein
MDFGEKAVTAHKVLRRLVGDQNKSAPLADGAEHAHLGQAEDLC